MNFRIITLWIAEIINYLFNLKGILIIDSLYYIIKRYAYVNCM